MVCHVFLCLALAYLFMRTEVQDTARPSRSQRVRIGGHETGKDSICLCGMELGWVVRDLLGSTLIPYCSNSVAKPRSSYTRRTSAGASSLGHRICRMWEACSKLPFIHDLRGRRTGRSSANGAPSHVMPTAQVAEGFFRNPEHPHFLLHCGFWSV
jgi:hypothetical protein